ncbi:hypothetical protein FRC01_000482 [Tulasnella sp. 417]|nr:hypothetical protein FRC01_000482 [Tulasnella sp. 417]
MHPTWDIPELVELIFDFLDPREAAKAATVCRIFWLAALPRSWRNVHTFDNLLNLLPHDIRGSANRGAIFNIKRPLSESDWERFLIYSYYTKALSKPIYQDTAELYGGIVQELPPTPIFPNLVSTELEIYWVPADRNLDFLHLFLPQTVSEVRIRAIVTVGRILQVLTKDIRTRNLKTLGLIKLDITKDNLNTSISQVLQSYEGIQALELELKTGSQILEVLLSAGHLRNLRRLDARTIQPDAAIALPSRGLHLELETLQLTGTFPFILSLLASVEPRSMRGVKMVVQKTEPSGSDGAPANAPFSDYLGSIRRFIHLKSLEMEIKIPVLLDDLRAILPCVDLETLRIVGPQLSSSEQGEDLVRAMVEAWPRLKMLELRSTLDSLDSAQALRLPHLQVIAKECQTLERLHISIDARGSKGPVFHPEGIETATKNLLRELEISCVQLQDVSGSGLVMIVKRMWPWLRLVSSNRELLRISGKVAGVTITSKFYYN